MGTLGQNQSVQEVGRVELYDRHAGQDNIPLSHPLELPGLMPTKQLAAFQKVRKKYFISLSQADWSPTTTWTMLMLLHRIKWWGIGLGPSAALKGFQTGA